MNSGLKDLMRLAADSPKPFDILLCASTDRIARHTDLAVRLHDALRRLSVEIRLAEISDTQL